VITRIAVFEGRIEVGCCASRAPMPSRRQRAQARAITLELLEMSEGRLYHVVSDRNDIEDHGKAP
jgi:hypothetical protein